MLKLLFMFLYQWLLGQGMECINLRFHPHVIFLIYYLSSVLLLTFLNTEVSCSIWCLILFGVEQPLETSLFVDDTVLLAESNNKCGSMEVEISVRALKGKQAREF